VIVHSGSKEALALLDRGVGGHPRIGSALSADRLGVSRRGGWPALQIINTTSNGGGSGPLERISTLRGRCW